MKTKIICLCTFFALFLAACSGKKSSRGDYEIANSAADSTSVSARTDTAMSAPKLVRTADMRFKVKNVARTCEDISTLASTYHGMVMHHAMQSSVDRSYDDPISADSVMHISSYNTTADMTVKIPSEKIEEFMNAIGKMAVYTNTRTMDIQDRTLDYLESNLKVQSRSEIIAQQRTNNIKIKNAESVMNLKDDLIEQRINNKRIDLDVKYSTIVLNFYQTNTIAKEVVVNDDPSNFRLPFFRRFGNALAYGWTASNDVIVALVNFWVLFVAGIVTWYVYRRVAKKKEVVKAA